MGMDVIGKNPTKPEGKYFGSNVWYWHPLWDYCETIAPEITSRVRNAHFNDGDGLEAAEALRLGERLTEEIESGRALEAVEKFNAERNSIPNERCDICDGTGKRAEPPAIGPGNMPCNACGGKGERRPISAWYGMHIEHVKKFAEFLKHCGGFEIW